MSTVSERARASRPMPKYIIRAKVGTGWTSIGAAWPLRSGEEGYSIKITAVPLQWDGRAVLLPPLENEDAAEDPPAEETPTSRRRKAMEPTTA